MIDVRSSWTVDEHGNVYPLGTEPPRRVGRDGQRARIRERIASHGTTETANMRAARAELKRRIAERSGK